METSQLFSYVAFEVVHKDHKLLDQISYFSAFVKYQKYNKCMFILRDVQTSSLRELIPYISSRQQRKSKYDYSVHLYLLIICSRQKNCAKSSSKLSRRSRASLTIYCLRTSRDLSDFSSSITNLETSLISAGISRKLLRYSLHLQVPVVQLPT